MYKLLFLINDLGNGGAEKVLVNLVNCLAEDDYDITVRTLIKGGTNQNHLSRKVHYEYVFKKAFPGLNYLYLLPHGWIYNRVVHGKYDVIIVFLHGVLTRIVSFAPKLQRTIAYLHANMEYSPFMKKFKSKNDIKKCFENYNRIVSVSQDIQQSFIKASGINDKRLVVKYNTFDVKKIRYNSRIKNSNLVLDKNRQDCILCSVGKLEKVKGYSRLLRIVRRLIEEGDSIKLIIVGEGSQKANLLKYIKENDLEKNVYLVGFDDNPYKYIVNSDLFVCSSYSEGFSSAVAESLILGVPVITTKCAGMREMIGENEFGVITDNNEDALYKGIKMIVSNKQLLDHYRSQAITRGLMFSTENTVQSVKKMIEEVMKE